MAPDDGDGAWLGGAPDAEQPVLGSPEGDAPLGGSEGDAPAGGGEADHGLGIGTYDPTPPDGCSLPPRHDLETLPDVVPWEPPPDADEIRIALERAQQIAADLRQVLKPAQQMMREGAWVSRSADTFSLELDENARRCGMIGERGVEAIRELSRRPPDDDLEFRPTYPQSM